MGILSLITGKPGASGFGSGSTAEQVTEGISAAGLTVLVTGGSSGIGLETSRVFALRGAHVIIAARNTEASEARKRIMEIHPLARVDVLKLDLSSLKSVRAFADQFNSMNLPLNILINNAGVMFCPFQLSEDEVEMQFATNHLGHFLLTNLLLDNMKTTAKSTGIEGRIVNLSSVAHLHTYPKGILFDQLNDKKMYVFLWLFRRKSNIDSTANNVFFFIGRYNDKMAYGQSKLANILHAKELSRRLKEEGANITVNCVHPGLIMTNLMRHSFALMKAIQVVTYLFWKNVPQGAATTCYVGLNPQLKGVTGKYFADCNEEKTSKHAKSDVLAKQLWEFSEELIRSAK
ncbi:short-chain dehydrogenase TIC 32 B, chloroplastic isoform X1 [Aegilops tauschii subsp. strangulata]|nr:short-chain dehydrogenase TIC 32 B, chloroplastic isoform X1 [Aegilops tauschii subsp. strangulata]XP_020201266.1 short-chain dehydrogenase TIC 32 B, chloroplastic isoform X1 [Aegilops tauschii subsp. strangulata]XP_044355327.1 short-chain dehydrogenase TIC 32 B, chloroplastic-like isoform X1 [Triticum aestivum]XP_044355328.1 short-chain dehydrogenase TIC 32 B, chloroplastic-like isoform X1 [Triticum aestivum]